MVTDHGGPLAQDAARGVPPQPDDLRLGSTLLPDPQRVGGKLFGGGAAVDERWVHRSRNLGSRKPYEMSTMRFTTT
jgi:hypothetical protein